jgi:HAD superfamily hydrolase (TIGR01490 family)
VTAVHRAAFFDIDGTLTSERTWKGLMDYFTAHGLRKTVHFKFLALHYPLYFQRRLRFISESAFRTPWAAHLAWYVRGDTPEQAQPVWAWAVERFLSRYWRADTRQLLEDHRRNGDLVILVSAAPLPLVERIALEVGAQYAVGTRFDVQQGRYSSRAAPPVVIDEGKADAARELLREKGLAVNLEASSAYADSISDLSLLEMVGNPVAVYPDEALRRVAAARGWRLFPPETPLLQR